MNCNHYSPEFVTARMREREAGREPPCPHCRLAEAEWLLQWVDDQGRMDAHDVFDFREMHAKYKAGATDSASV
jgi:hypothetical protein